MNEMQLELSLKSSILITSDFILVQTIKLYLNSMNSVNPESIKKWYGDQITPYVITDIFPEVVAKFNLLTYIWLDIHSGTSMAKDT